MCVFIKDGASYYNTLIKFLDREITDKNSDYWF